MKLPLISSSVFIYILKCITGLSICYILYIQFPQHQFFWSMISVLLALAPNQGDGNRLAYDRIKANITGSVIGLLLILLHAPNLLLMCLGVVITIIAGIFFHLENATRSALAALMIVMFYEQKDPGWHVAFERVLCVITGCIVALIITWIFTFVQNLMRKKVLK